MINNTIILTNEELRTFFHNNKIQGAGVNVSTEIRRKWMLNHEKTIIDGKVRDINFENVGGRVWLATLI